MKTTLFILLSLCVGPMTFGNNSQVVNNVSVESKNYNSTKLNLSDFNGVVRAFAVIGTDLYVGGFFTLAGGVPAHNIAKWNGSNWSNLGNGMNGIVNALTVINGVLYAGGNFTTAGDSIETNIARWDGVGWDGLGNGVGTNGEVLALATQDGKLYAGGKFNSVDGIIVNYIAEYDGLNWSPLGNGMNNWVKTMTANDSILYVGGYFTSAGFTPANHIAKWENDSWQSIGNGPNNGVNDNVFCIAQVNELIYVGGYLTMAGIVPSNFLACWNGFAWTPVGSMNDIVTSFAVKDSTLFVGGDFTTTGFVNARRIALFDGSFWFKLDSGMNNQVSVMTIIGNILYAGGAFTIAGGLPANYIASWNGFSWASVLPVNLESFYCSIFENNIKLNWTTSFEENNAGFEIERNLNNSGWKKIGFIIGNGNSNIQKTYSFEDRFLPSGNYCYRLKQLDYNGNHDYYNLNNEIHIEIPVNYSLFQNYPNPFNPSTNIRYNLPIDTKVYLSVFDLTGKEISVIVNSFQPAGYYNVNFNSSNLASGIYFYRIKTVEFVDTKRMVLVK